MFTTNIRILEEDYHRLKQEAAKKRKSLSAIIRKRIKARGQTQSSGLEEAKQVNLPFIKPLDTLSV